MVQVYPENVAMNNKSVSRHDLSNAATVESGQRDRGVDIYENTFKSMPRAWESSLQHIPEFAANDGTYELALKMNALDILFYDYVREKFGNKLINVSQM